MKSKMCVRARARDRAEWKENTPYILGWFLCLNLSVFLSRCVHSSVQSILRIGILSFKLVVETHKENAIKAKKR